MSSTSYLILQISILPSSNFPNADCDIFSIFAQFSDGRPRHHSFPAVQHPREDETQNRVLTFIKELSKPKKNIYFRLYRVLFKIVCVIHSPLIDFQFAQCSIKCSILKNSLNHLIRGKAHCPSQQKFKSTICIHHLYNESFCVQLCLQLLCALVHLADPGRSPRGPVSQLHLAHFGLLFVHLIQIKGVIKIIPLGPISSLHYSRLT